MDSKPLAYKDLREPLGRAMMALGQEVNELRNRIAGHKHEAIMLEARLAPKEALYKELQQQVADANAFVREQYKEESDGQ